jgi:WD40 repeat protein
MNENEVVRIARLWMEDGPSMVPDRVLTAALTEVHVTAQRHRGPLERVRSMKSFSLLAAASVAGVVALFFWTARPAIETTTEPADAAFSFPDRPSLTVPDLGLAFSSDGSRLFAGSGWPAAAVATIFDASTGAVIHRQEPEARDAWGVEAFSPDGRLVAIGTDRTTVYETETGRYVAEFTGCCLATFGPDGRTIALGATIYDVETSKSLDRIHPVDGDGVFSPDGTRMLLSGRGGEERADRYGPGVLGVIVDATKRWDGSAIQLMGEGQVRVYNILGAGAAWSPDGTMVAQPTSFGNVHVWDARTGELRHDLDVEPIANVFDATSVAFSPDSRLLVVGTSDGSLVQFDLTSDKPVPLVYRALGTPVFTVSFTPDGQRLMAGSWDEGSRIWDIAR